MNTQNLYPNYDPSEYELEVKTGTEILDDIYLPKHEIISGILPRGTYLLGGASKTGKSFMVLQLAYHIVLQSFQRLQHVCRSRPQPKPSTQCCRC